MTDADLVERLAATVDVLARERTRTLVAVDGPDAAGKTVLACRLSAALSTPAVHAGIDGFHRARSQRHRRGRLSADGYYFDSYDEDALVGHLLAPFTAGEADVATAVFDDRADTPVTTLVTATDRCLLVVDGVFLLRQSLRRWWTLSIYLHIGEEEVLRRAIQRDADLLGSQTEVRRRYRQRYLPGQRLYRRDADPHEQADIVIDNTNVDAPQVLRWSPPSGSCQGPRLQADVKMSPWTATSTCSSTQRTRRR